MARVISFFVSILILFSCNSISPVELAFYRTLNEGMEKSIKNISYHNDLVYKEFQNKKSDPSTATKASEWSGRMDLYKQLSDSLVKYIHGLKYDIDPIESKDGDKELVKKIFIAQNKSDELYDKILAYENEMFDVDETIKKAFLDKGSAVIKIDSTKIFFKRNYFLNQPLIAAKTILNKIENDVRLMENEFMTFCNYNTSVIIEHYDSFSTLIGQSSSIVKTGEEIKIQAGVGAFSAVSKPTVLIDGKVLKPENQNGVVIYSFKAPQKSGKYSKRITIEFIKEDGTKEKTSEVIEYTVKD